MSELWRMSASEIAAMVATRAVSAREVALSALARLSAVNESINAVVDEDPETAIAQAAEVDATIARGEAPGPLAGVTVTIKVNIDQAGYATTNGTVLQKDLIATTDSPVVKNLRAAGAVVIGRTNTPAYSSRWFTSNNLHGRTSNPRNTLITSGGSSGGAASAVAAGIGHLAVGTDIGGSIRYPAYACGVQGIRPSLGRVAAYNATDAERKLGQQLMSVTGPLARSIADVRLGLGVLAGGDPRDIWWTPAPLMGPPVHRRAAMCTKPDGMATCDAVVRELIAAADALRAAGWSVDEVETLPPLRELCELQAIIWMGDGAEAFVKMAERANDEGAIASFSNFARRAGEATLTRFVAALTRRAAIKRQWNVFFENYPVVLLPLSAELPFDEDFDLGGTAAFDALWDAQMTMIATPVLGIPGLAVATGIAQGRPVGVQVLAATFREDLCFEAGAAIESGRGQLPIALTAESSA